jgi:electron transfer flavoprotein-quinone oxidoreductase
MNSSQYDVVIVGAGAAGLTAAIGLARMGFAVAAVEAADYPGAENWSGCVYFCENLADPDILGPAGVEGLAWERRLVERGLFGTDGHSLLGMTYRDPAAFRHCYTVLRPIYDHHLAQVALRCGVALLDATTAESLIREGGRVVGVCTNRGPLYADLTFLAEGDASHLVTREGYERSTDPREAPKFLQGIKQVIELPPGAIEELFDVGPEEGVAYEMVLRNGSLRGRPVHLNMGGFVYTNRQSLSVGLVLPADNLHEHFGGDPNLLLEWFEDLPALRPWVRQGRRGVFGAKLIRGGGARDIPTLIDDGLAVGGAASGVGVDFPYPNFTGPATAMGLLLTRAARRIREEGAGFTRDNLRRHYLEPLQRTHYWRDVEFLRRWPGYVKRTKVFFGRNLDLALGTAFLWTRPDRWFLTKWINWVRLVLQVAGPGRWHELRHDLRHLVRALRLREVTDRPSLGRLLLDGTVNALRDLCGRPRANLPAAGTIRMRYWSGGGDAEGGRVTKGPAPALVRRWFRRFSPVLASTARRVYVNDETPLADKLSGATRLLMKQVNLLDLLGAGALALAAGLTAVWLLCWERLAGWLRRRPGQAPRGLYRHYALAQRQATDLTPAVAPAAAHWEARLAWLGYETVNDSHIHVRWPRALQDKNAVAGVGLWHVCPAQVYEARVSPLGQVQLVVNFENCIKCETCWRTSDLVDWGRDGKHRFVYPVGSPVASRLIEAVHAAGMARPALPLARDHWEPAARALADQLRSGTVPPLNGEGVALLHELRLLLVKLDRKLQEFDEALSEEPRTVDPARSEYLEMLARYAQQLAVRVVEELRKSPLADSPHAGVAAAHRRMLELATALLTKAEERSRRCWDQHFAWAAGGGRQLRQHHLAGLGRLLATFARHVGGPTPAEDPARPWLRAEDDAAAVAERLADWSARLDAVFAPSAWRDLERQLPLTSEQDAVLRDLLAQVPVPDPADLPGTLHPPSRKGLLAELGRRDPSLAYRAASHLWARDLAHLASGSSAAAAPVARWTRGDEWACFAAIDAVQTAYTAFASPDGEKEGGPGGALLIPALGARAVLLLLGDQLLIVPTGTPGLRIEPLATLGLRGAGLARVQLETLDLPATRVAVDSHRIRRVWRILAAADLTSIAFGMADLLCRRAVEHATSRVQFPGLFHDEEARDPIGKFGAVKKMVAEMGARRYLLETLDHALSPTDFSGPWVERAGLVKATVAEALGTAPGSLSYNAGQVFGGTGYSEDDLLAKFYRDAAAWRFLVPTDSEVYRRRGYELLRGMADPKRLAPLANDAGLFEEAAQRKALQTELDEVRNLGSRLRGLLADWHEAGTATASSPASAAHAAEFAEGLARQEAHLLASKALLLRTHARLEHGLNAETEVALLRTWLEGVSVSVEQFDALARRRLDGSGRRSDRPVVEPALGPPVTLYADYLAASGPYDSGDFLITPVDLVHPRLVPEMVAADPSLAERDRAFRELLSEHFGSPRTLQADPGSAAPCDGSAMAYERYIERRHRMDAADLDFCRRHGFFRLPIPKDLGGEGRPKVDYYLLTTNAQRLADVAVSLTIQAHTSIGTTPVLLARDKDLPRAKKDLGPFVGDPALQKEIREEVKGLLGLVQRPDPKRIEQAYLKLQKRLEKTVLARTVLKVLAHRFVEAWQQAGRAGREFDLPGMKTHLEGALRDWNDACGRAEELHGEIARRQEACDLFLRWIATGQISAFALTEPSAGSDTARVATRARPRSVPVEKDEDGALHFVPAGGREPRYVVDARRLEFRPNGVYYRWSDAAEPSPVRFDEYDYETDDPSPMRFYDHGGRRVPFTDVAQLRARDGRTWYDYWELTGAKMWITNGRIAGVMCLYAKTQEGVTGFMVDRHAEGLVVGKDEAKMGQCGSPTNELSLQAVRVPRENVIGLEGRGQVNALETLNVGRAGLAMSAVAQMAGLIESSRAFARQTYGDVPDWAEWRLQRMEEDAFTAEALAYEVIGRFEHPQTKSERMESAVSKMVVSELLHRVIELAEDVHGLAGQTQLHLVEKRKRDARILNIYEGTNEVQRFFILKDLAAEVAPRWSQAAPPRHLGREALELEALKGDARQRVEAALEIFGQGLWQNPNLQANCFLLAEVAAWLKAADSTLYRLAWLSRLELAAGGQWAEEGGAAQQLPGEPAGEAGKAPPDLLAGLQAPLSTGLAQRAFARCCAEVRDRLRSFDGELSHLRRGYYAPEVRAASLLFDRQAETPLPLPPPSQITRPLSVLVIVEPMASGVPHPHVAGGRLLEPHLTLNAADRSALESALRLREEASAPVTVEVVAVAPKGAAQVLREALSVGTDRVRLVVPEAEAVTADSAAAALAAVLGTGSRFDLILGGTAQDGGEEGLVARLTAESLGVPHAGAASRLAAQVTDGDANLLLVGADKADRRVRPLPVSVAVEAGLPLRTYQTADYLAGLDKTVEVIRWPKRVPARPVSFAATAEAAADSPPEEAPRPLTPGEAALQILSRAGVSGMAFAPSFYQGEIAEVSHPTLLEAGAAPAGRVVAVLATGTDGGLQTTAAATLGAARLAAGSLGARPVVLLLAPQDEGVQRRCLAQLAELFAGDTVLLSAAVDGASIEVKSRLLSECWPNLENEPRAVVGEAWTEAAFAALGSRQGKADAARALRIRRVDQANGLLSLETTRDRGRLRLRQTVDPLAQGTWWMSLAGEVEVGNGREVPPGEPLRVQRWSARLERFYGRAEIQRLLDELKDETGLVRLADADFILDVGFGISNRDGYEAVIEPLEQVLREAGVRNLVVGGSRKVTEELHLLPADRQIGQSGVSVNPQVLLAVGVSGAPQHLNYIGPRATVVAFNRDAEAPIMTLNQRQPKPRVFPVVGDLFETVPALIAALRNEQPAEPERPGQLAPETAPT